MNVGLYSIKPRFVKALKHFEDAIVARRISADVLTIAAIVVSAAAGLFIAAGGLLGRPWLWLAVPPLGLMRLALNALDGSIARRTGTDRPFGTVLNEVSDRLSDAALIGGTSFVVPPTLAFGALASTFLASSSGVLALAVAGERDSGGPMGKADRVFVLALAATVAGLGGSEEPFHIALWVIAAGTVVTAALRVARLGKNA